MANYVFENMTQAQAAAFTTTDKLVFLNATDANLTVTFAPAGSLTQDAITLTSGTQTLTFAANAIATASQSNNLFFVNGDVLLLSGATGQALDLSTAGVGAVSGKGGAAYGFGGNDTITGSVANDTVNGGDGNDTIINNTTTVASATESDYLYGGAGGDTITGGAGNEHIYGNSLTTVQGAADGADSITAGAGNDYVRGNAGNDTINGGDGNDRLEGSADNDTVNGDAGNDNVNGNLGNDTVTGGDGNDTVGGGQDDDQVNGNDGNDLVNGGLGNDVLAGDAGDDTVNGGDGTDLVSGNVGNDVLNGGAGVDTIVGGTGFDNLTGGAGNDIFRFAAGDNTNANIPGAGATAGLVDTITDYTDGADKFDLNQVTGVVAADFVPAAVLLDTQGTVFATLQAAQTYAQQLMDNTAAANNTEVAALKIGGDTFLFYYGNTAATAIDSVIKLAGVADPTVIGTSDFIA